MGTGVLILLECNYGLYRPPVSSVLEGCCIDGGELDIDKDSGSIKSIRKKVRSP